MIENECRKRNRTLDIIKGFIIIFVVLVHLSFSAASNSDPSPNENVDFLKEYLYSALILFFVISGYCYKNRGFVANMKKRTIQIGGSFVIFTIVLTSIMAGLQALYGYNISLDSILNVIGNTLIGTGTFTDYATHPFVDALATFEVTMAYYFLEILFFAFIIFYAIAEYSTKNWKTTLITMFILTSASFIMRQFVPVRFPWYLQNVPIAAAFMVLGLYLKKRKVLDFIDSKQKEKKYWVSFFIIFAMSLILLALFPTRMSFINSTFGDYEGWSAFSFVIVTALCGYVIAVLCSLVSRIPKISDVIIFIGSNTMVIFLLHIFYAKLIAMQFHELHISLGIPFNGILESIIVSVVVIVLCIATVQIYDRKIKPLFQRISQ